MKADATLSFRPPSLIAELEGRLRRGEHLALYGPRGTGKSALMAALHSRLSRAGVPCALSPATRSLDDITRTLEQAYPGVETLNLARRTARVRLWRAADQRMGVLLLDHFSSVSTAMIGYLRRLHGGVIGALSAVDVENESERARMRPWRYGAMSVRMPMMPPPRLRRLLRARWAALALPSLGAEQEDYLTHEARGRPGWIARCAELGHDARYWRSGRLLLSVLSIDTEVAVRYGTLTLVRPLANPDRAP